MGMLQLVRTLAILIISGRAAHATQARPRLQSTFRTLGPTASVRALDDWAIHKDISLILHGRDWNLPIDFVKIGER